MLLRLRAADSGRAGPRVVRSARGRLDPEANALPKGKGTSEGSATTLKRVHTNVWTFRDFRRPFVHFYRIVGSVMISAVLPTFQAEMFVKLAVFILPFYA